MPQPQIKISFRLPAASADWAGQALVAYFPDGLLSGPPQGGLIPFSGWPGRRDNSSLEKLKGELSALGASRLRLKRERQRDWVREYKSRFPVQPLGRFVILPEWRKRAKLAPGKHAIILMPGQAFGTGLHASTRLMLKAIGAMGGLKGQSVLDIGAGSGVLGLASLRLGAGKILSLEIEEAACEEMKGNAALNGFKPGQFAVRCGAFPQVMKGKKARADLVLANIVTPVLCALMRPIAAQAAKGGTLLFSGIHTLPEAKRVAKAAAEAGLKVKARESKGEWWCLRALK